MEQTTTVLGSWGLSLQSLAMLAFGLKFVATALLSFAIGRLFIAIYRSHGYLYQWKDKEQFIGNWVDYLLPLVKLLRWRRYRTFLKVYLRQAGWRPDWDDNEFLALQLMVGCLAFVLTFIVLTVFAGKNPAFAVVVACLAMGLQTLQLYERARVRLVAMNRDLPFFIDYLALAMLAGMGFNQALDKVVANVVAGPLTDEFLLINKSLNLGMTREKALYQFKERLRSPQAAQFVETLVQAMEQGSGVADTLQAIASGLNLKRFQRAEEEAGKISVKMMIPVIVFILPALMLILLGPIILELTKV